MRVVHVVRSLRRETGGLAEAVRHLAEAQRQRGDAVAVVSLDSADRADSSVTVLGLASHGYGFSPRYVPWLRTHAAEYDLVVVHGLWQYQSFGAWRALGGTATPYVIFPHGMLDVWFKRAHPLKHVKKWLYWPWAEYRVLRDATAVCYTTEDERRRARMSFWLYRARETIAPIGIAAPGPTAAADVAAFATAHPQLSDRRYLLFLGRIHPKKGLDLLFRAYAEIYGQSTAAPDLAIAGPCDDPVYLDRLRTLVCELRLESRVRWLPMLSGPVKWGALRGCEAFALFSHQENFGVAVVEALACSRPVLISDQIALSDDIRAAGAGVVAPDSDAGARHCLAAWRDLPAEDRAKMSAAAAGLFASRYDVRRAADEFANLIGGGFAPTR